MKNNKMIKLYNLFLTDTIDKNSYDADSIKETSVNIDNSISLYDLINIYYRLHKSFKEEYDDINKISLGDSIEVLSLIKYIDHYYNQCRELALYITKPILVNYPYAYFYLCERGNKTKIVMSYENEPINDIIYFYLEKKGLTKEVIIEYLDLFEKYRPLLDLYNHFKKKNIFDNGICSLSIDTNSKSFLDDVGDIKVYLKHKFSDKIESIEISQDLLEDIYINKKYLSKSFCDIKIEENDNVKIKTLNNT